MKSSEIRHKYQQQTTISIQEIENDFFSGSSTIKQKSINTIACPIILVNHLILGAIQCCMYLDFDVVNVFHTSSPQNTNSTVPVYMSREHEIIIWFLGGFCFYGPYRWTFTQSSSWNPGNLLVAGRQRWGLPQILDGQPSSQPMGQNMGLSHIIGCRMMRGVWKIIWRHLPYIKISYKSRI